MAYGIQVSGINNIYQLDTLLSSTVHMTVVHSGVTTGTNGQIANYTSGDLVVGRPTSGSGVFGSNFISSPPTLNVAGTYKILRAISGSSSTSLNGSTYGAVVYKANGTTKQFDSRTFANGFGINTIWHSGSLYGAKQSASSLTTANNTVWTSTSSSNYTNTMVSLNGGLGVHNLTAFDSFYFDTSVGTGRVLFHSFIDFQGALGAQLMAIANFSEILVGDFK